MRQRILVRGMGRTTILERRIATSLGSALVAVGFAACSSASAPVPDADAGESGGARTPMDGGGMDASMGPGAGGAPSINTPDGGMVGDGSTFFRDVVSLVFDRAAAQMDCAVGGVATLSLGLVATRVDGTTRAVPAEYLELDRPDLGKVVAGPPITITSSCALGGVGKLHAVFGGVEATIPVHVTVRERDVGSVDPAVVAALDATFWPGASLDAGIAEAGTPDAGPSVDSGTSDGAAMGLPTDDTALAALLYPYDQTVFPLGLDAPLLMWNAPNTTGDVYRLHLQVGHYAYDWFGPVTAPAQLRIPQATWERATASSAGGSDQLIVTLSRWDSVARVARSSVVQRWTVATQSLRGAIYYWTASQASSTADRVGSIVRIRPGTGASIERLNEGRCMGCHSVSADGTTLAATIEDPTAPTVAPFKNWSNSRALGVFALPKGDLRVLTTMAGANSALTPNGQYVVFGGRSNPFVPGAKFLELADTATGTLLSNSGLDDLKPADERYGFMMPAFSIDGTKLALVEAEGNLEDNVLPEPSRRIVYIGFDPKGGDAGGPHFDPTLHEIVNASQLPPAAAAPAAVAPLGNAGLGYPSFTPDSKWVAFHTGPWSTGCHADPYDSTVPTCIDPVHDHGELWMSAVAGGASPVRLSRLGDPPANADRYLDREPTFNPLVRGGYAWVVFTSMRDWGNKIAGEPVNGKRRLWVAAIDTQIGAADPSHPAFYLEGQKNEEPNMRGFWVNASCIETPKPGQTGGACTAGFECCSGFCVGGQCVDKSAIACVGSGETCASDADCCNRGAMVCMNNRCMVKAPVH